MATRIKKAQSGWSINPKMGKAIQDALDKRPYSGTELSPAERARHEAIMKQRLKEIQENENLKKNPYGGGKGKKGIKVKAKSGAKMMVKAKAKVSKAKYGTKKKK